MRNLILIPWVISETFSQKSGCPHKMSISKQISPGLYIVQQKYWFWIYYILLLVYVSYLNRKKRSASFYFSLILNIFDVIFLLDKLNKFLFYFLHGYIMHYFRYFQHLWEIYHHSVLIQWDKLWIFLFCASNSVSLQFIIMFFLYHDLNR